MIIVTGATGALNGATVEHLLTRVPASEIAVAVRDPARARSFADRAATTPTPAPCRARSPARISCCSCRPATRRPMP
jgi:nucleoside-diphosphate-sugar epimerase